MRFRPICCALLLALLAACEPKATPFPVDIPTPATATPIPGTVTPVRYALAGNTAGSVADLSLLESGTEVTLLDGPASSEDLGSSYDVIATYGAFSDATPSPVQVNVALLIHTDLAPLDNPDLAAILQQGIDSTLLAQAIDLPGLQVTTDSAQSPDDLRAALANAGWPDGVDLSLAYTHLLGAEAVQVSFEHTGIHLSLRPADEAAAPTHLTLVTWTTPEQRQEWAGSDHTALVDLFALPISYWAVPGLEISYSPQGWPVAARP